MTNEQILKRAINKAVKNGYKYKWKMTQSDWDYEIQWFLKENSYHSFIFSHDFAKAFWGEKKLVKDTPFYTTEVDKKTGIPFYGWQLCLQQMVLEKEPLKYLEKFL